MEWKHWAVDLFRRQPRVLHVCLSLIWLTGLKKCECVCLSAAHQMQSTFPLSPSSHLPQSLCSALSPPFSPSLPLSQLPLGYFFLILSPSLPLYLSLSFSLLPSLSLSLLSYVLYTHPLLNLIFSHVSNREVQVEVLGIFRVKCSEWPSGKACMHPSATQLQICNLAYIKKQVHVDYTVLQAMWYSIEWCVHLMQKVWKHSMYNQFKRFIITKNHFQFHFFSQSKEMKVNWKSRARTHAKCFPAAMSEPKLELRYTTTAWEETSRGDTSPGLTSLSPSPSNLSISTRVTARRAARLPGNLCLALAPRLVHRSKFWRGCDVNEVGINLLAYSSERGGVSHEHCGCPHSTGAHRQTEQCGSRGCDRPNQPVNSSNWYGWHTLVYIYVDISLKQGK